MARAYTPPVNRVVPVKKSKIQGLSSFGDNNLFPQDYTEIVNTSVTASACHDVKMRFIGGNGFMDTALSKRVIHRSGLTLDRMLDAQAENLSAGEGIFVHVNYNALGQKVGMRPVDWQIVRFGEADEDGIIRKAGICRYINSTLYKKKQKDVTYIDMYDPNPEVVKAQIAAAGGIQNYEGQLFVAYLFAPNAEDYLVPRSFAAIKAMQTEIGLDIYDNSTVENGFNVPGAFVFLGKPRATVEGQVLPENDPNTIQYQLRQSLGPENSGNVLTLEVETAAEVKLANFVPFTDAKLADRYSSTNDRVERRITRAWRVPNELAMIQRDGGVMFSNEELEQASKWMQFQVNREQRLLKDSFTELLSNWYGQPNVPDCSIQNLDYFSPQTQQAG